MGISTGKYGKIVDFLVGGAITILKNDGVLQWEGLFHILWKIKQCLKPPVSFCMFLPGVASMCIWLATFGYPNHHQYHQCISAMTTTSIIHTNCGDHITNHQ